MPRLVTNSDGSRDLVALLNDNFGPGPYSFARVENVNAKVAGSNYADVCLSSSSSTPPVAKTTDNGGGSVENSKNTTIIILSVFVGLLGTVVVALSYMLYAKAEKKPMASVAESHNTL